jgi:hypothetical protein
MSSKFLRTVVLPSRKTTTSGMVNLSCVATCSGSYSFALFKRLT